MLFSGRAKDKYGNITTGSPDAGSSSLHGDQTAPTQIRAANRPSPFESFITAHPSGRERMMMFHQLGIMLRAGIRLSDALDMIAREDSSKRVRRTADDLKMRVDSGRELSAALSENGAFQPITISLVRAGEAAGAVGMAVEQAAMVLEKVEDFKRRMRSALTYPMIVAAFAVVVVISFTCFVLPKFEQVFKRLNVELPALTKFMLDMSRLFSAYYPIILLLAAGTCAFLFSYRAFLRHKLAAGRTSAAFYMACVTRIMATAVKTGVPVLTGLEVAAGANRVEAAQKKWRGAIEAMRMGDTLSSACHDNKLFSAGITRMISVGEETGRLGEILEKIAQWHENEFDDRIKRLAAIIEPALIITVGLLVAAVSLSVYSPINAAIRQFTW